MAEHPGIVPELPVFKIDRYLAKDDYPKQEYFRVGNFKNTKTIGNLILSVTQKRLGKFDSRTVN